MKKLLIVTDLDATFIDDDYQYADAIEALLLLSARGYPLVFNSSKTFSELKDLADQLKLHTPIIAENGGIIAVPDSFSLPEPSIDSKHHRWERRDGYQTLVTGLSREVILQHAHAARTEQAYLFAGFNDWSDAEVAARTGLSQAEASMANQRHVSEPIIWQDTEQRWNDFHAAMQSQGIRALRGGRFIHLMGQADKADGLRAVQELYSQKEPETQWTTVALGDSPNDQAMLEAADIPVVIPHSEGPRLQVGTRHVMYADYPASKGWNDAMLRILSSF